MSKAGMETRSAIEVREGSKRHIETSPEPMTPTLASTATDKLVTVHSGRKVT